MFNSSLRRVARSCPNASVSTRPTTGHVPIIATFTTQCHQRRHSSSKPPIPPNNGAPSIPATSVKQVGAPRTDKRPTTDARLSKRKTAKGDKTENAKVQEEPSNEWTRNLPSVPSTQHLNPKDIYVASFFSTHRPISITGPLPPETQVEDIDKIFQGRPKSRGRKSQDVIYTINSAVQQLDEQISNQQDGPQHEEGISQRTDLIKALTQHNQGITSTTNQATDGQPPTSIRVPGNVKLVIQEFAKRFRPFNVPPPPEPVPEIELIGKEETDPSSTSSSDSQAQTTAEAEASGTLYRRHGKIQVEIVNQSEDPQVQQVVLNMPGTSHATPDFFTSQVPSNNKGGRTRRGSSSSSKVIHSASSLRRIKMAGIASMSAKQRGPTTTTTSVYAISVKRQRKVKMKKHKQRKLRKRTRNLRRREGKI